VRRAARTIAILAVVLVAAGWLLLRTGVLSSTLTATWSYDYTPFPSCSSERTANCIDHFEILDITNQEKHRFVEAIPSPAVAPGKIESISKRFKYGPPYGEITLSVVAVKRGEGGSLITSNPFAARATVKLLPGVRASISFF
jgi:hypothetical protein